jgi:hypothetical protein
MKTLIEMAREAGFEEGIAKFIGLPVFERFAELVRADEREAWMKPHPKCDGGCMYQCTKGYTQFPECATTPPAAQRQWVGLTEDEVSQIIGEQIGFNSCWGPEEDFAKAIEAKLKEKNSD